MFYYFTPDLFQRLSGCQCRSCTFASVKASVRMYEVVGLCGSASQPVERMRPFPNKQLFHVGIRCIQAFDWSHFHRGSIFYWGRTAKKVFLLPRAQSTVLGPDRHKAILQEQPSAALECSKWYKNLYFWGALVAEIGFTQFKNKKKLFKILVCRRQFSVKVWETVTEAWHWSLVF